MTNHKSSEDQDFVRRVAANVRRLRRDQGLTQEEMAHAAGISARALGQIERAEAVMVITTARRIAAALNVEIGELFSLSKYAG